MEFSTRFPYSEMELSAYEMVQSHFRLTEINFKTAEITEIAEITLKQRGNYAETFISEYGQ